jgi:outer membrane protein TolC
MVGAGFRFVSRSLHLRSWGAGLCAVGLPLLAAGCTPRMGALTQLGAIPRRAVATRLTTPGAALDSGVRPAAYESEHPQMLPTPIPTPAPTPVNLDAIFHLAEEKNAQIALAREKVHESCLDSQLAAKAWLPTVTAGVGYYRHEGGIQNEDGTLTRSSFGALYPNVDLHADFDVRAATIARIDAERKRWQQQGELSRVNYETLLDAANTYIDLLSARRGEAVAQELDKDQRDVLKRAEGSAASGGKILVESVQAELSGSAQASAKLRQQGDAASAKLAYLLGLDPECPLVPVDEALAPLDVVDATPPTPALVARALTDGPGIHELQGLMAVIDSGMAELAGPKRFLPTFGLCTTEGYFGAGPNGVLTGSNRFDLGVQARWNLTDLLKAGDMKRIAESKRRQVELSYEDLRGKLTLGVRESRDEIVSGREQIEQASEQIRRASEAYRLSKLRVEENVPGSSPAEVSLALRGLAQAHGNYISSVNAYNKAQIRLLLLLGSQGTCKADAAPVIVASPVK